MSEEAKSPRLEIAIRECFAPVLRADGFSGSGRTFRRELAGWVQIVNVQSSRHGGQFAINLAAQPLAVPHVLGGLPDPKKITESHCEFRRRLSSTPSDQWWEHESTQESMNSAVRAAAVVYADVGRELLDRVCGPHAPIDLLTPEEFDRGTFDFAGFGSTKIRMALVLARMRRAQGRIVESAGFAKIGLDALGRTVGLRREFEELASQQ